MKLNIAFHTRKFCAGNNVIPAGEVIQGVRVFLSVRRIDGVGGIKVRSGACVIEGTHTRFGLLTFDSADMNTLGGDRLQTLVRHHIGHILGIGRLWQRLGLVAQRCPQIGVCNTSPRYIGANGNAACAALGGTGQVSIADQGRFRNQHWKEPIFGKELMTSVINPGVNPLSVMTVRIRHSHKRCTTLLVEKGSRRKRRWNKY